MEAVSITVHGSPLVLPPLPLPMSKPRPIFDRRIFWDVDFDRLDCDGKSGFIIERVFERGDEEDIRQCRRYYGDER